MIQSCFWAWSLDIRTIPKIRTVNAIDVVLRNTIKIPAVYVRFVELPHTITTDFLIIRVMIVDMTRVVAAVAAVVLPKELW